MSVCSICAGDHPATECPQAGSGTNWDDPTELGLKPATGDIRPGMTVGEYSIVERIGQGGMGVVWAGVQPLIGRKVAIKILHNGSDPQAAARFLKEAQAASRIRHHNVVDVYSFGQLPDGRSFLVMEFLDGIDLAEHLNRTGPMPFDRALPILEGILGGLRASHEKGIIHRDLKPENIWLLPTEDNGPPTQHSVKLLDFGLAKLVDQPDGRNSLMTRAGAPLGTPAYMSPEQCRGVLDVDHRSDLYSLGVIMYQMFSGHVPFDGESHIDVINRHLGAAPPSLARAVGMGPALNNVILKALAKRPEDRFQTAAEMRDAIRLTDAEGWIPRPGTATAIDLDPTPADEERQHTRADDARQADTLKPGQKPPKGSVYRAPLSEAVLIDDLTVQPDLVDDDTLTLAFHGELDRDDSAGRLADFLAAVTDAMRDKVRRVVLDIEGLAFMNSGGLQSLAAWLTVLRDMRHEGLAPVTIRYTGTVRWQASTTATLQRADPSLRIENAD
jgi:serine/threonine protein kinase